MPTGNKTALDEVIAARNAKQAQKSVKQLYMEASGALAPKVRLFCMFFAVVTSGASRASSSTAMPS